MATDEMKRLRMGPLLGEMVRNMEKASKQKIHSSIPVPEAKLYLYSGHDSTVASLLGALGVYDRFSFKCINLSCKVYVYKCLALLVHIHFFFYRYLEIPYSAAVIVELHQENKMTPEPGAYFVKVQNKIIKVKLFTLLVQTLFGFSYKVK